MTTAKIKSRATPLNIEHRFDKATFLDIKTNTDEDVWWQEVEEDFLESDTTELIKENCKTIVSKNRSPDVPFENSINPYRGCEHGCVYCYARPSHAYWDLSPGYDFESKIIYKANAPELLEEKFNSRCYRASPICIGANTDGYQPAEKQLKITRKLLEICLEYKHPVSIISKSALVCRDIDILSGLAEHNLISVAISVTTLSNELKRKLEPRTASPAARLNTIKALADSGIPVTSLVAPIIPGINDEELESIVESVAGQGATSASYIILRLPFEVKPLFLDWLERHYPLRKDKVINFLRSLREGKLNDKNFKSRMSGMGVYAELIRKRFDLACKKAGLLERRNLELNTGLFHPIKARNQLTLF